ncbi:hypothetical protein JTE90_004703 [Oedothorax gibbosus]|uniref:Uncharacterized protein n=1 Tax=Oedothorax gibbosus TaxID=931172 RepID=A0AAV6UAN5_9ARAC|nr:hypothetical protein JTE90_004703 [Oedothorax gibbosus]
MPCERDMNATKPNKYINQNSIDALLFLQSGNPLSLSPSLSLLHLCDGRIWNPKVLVCRWTDVFDAFRSRGVQPLHLPPAAGVWGRGAAPDFRPLREHRQRKGLHRQGHQSEQMLRFCELRQPGQCARGHPSHERVPGGHQETQGAAQEAQGVREALLTHTTVPN